MNVVSRWEPIINNLSFSDIYIFSLVNNGKLNRQVNFFIVIVWDSFFETAFYRKIIFNILD